MRNQIYLGLSALPRLLVVVLYHTQSTAHRKKISYEDEIWNTKFTSKLSLWFLKALTIPLARRRHPGLTDRKYSPSEDRDKALMAYSCSLANSRFALHSHVCGDNVVNPTTNYSRLVSWSLDPLSHWSLAYYRTCHHFIRFGFLIQILPYFKAAMAIKKSQPLVVNLQWLKFIRAGQQHHIVLKTWWRCCCGFL